MASAKLARHPVLVVASVYIAAFTAIVLAASGAAAGTGGRSVLAVCGAVDVLLSWALIIDVGGVNGAVRERGLVWLIKPNFVTRGWAERTRPYAVIVRVFAGAFFIFGVLVIVSAITGDGLRS